MIGYHGDDEMGHEGVRCRGSACTGASGYNANFVTGDAGVSRSFEVKVGLHRGSVLRQSFTVFHCDGYGDDVGEKRTALEVVACR